MIPWSTLFPPETHGPILKKSFRLIKRRLFPLIFLPVDPSAAARAMEVYSPQTRVAMALKRLFIFFSRHRLSLPFTVVEVQISIKSAFGNFLAEFAEPGDDFPEFGVLCGNPHAAGRRFVFIILGKDNAPKAIVKASSTRNGRELIRREAKFLNACDGQRTSIPGLLQTYEDGHVSALVIPFFAGESPPPQMLPNIQSILINWILPGPSHRLAEFSAWQALARSDEPLFHRASKWIGPDRMVQPVIYHGDFAPWNLRLDRDGTCIILDWERGSEQAIPAWDWFHYVVQTSILVFGDKPEETNRRLADEFKSEAFQQYCIRAGIEDIVLGLLIGYLVHAYKQGQAEGSEDLCKLICSFDEHWPGWDAKPRHTADTLQPLFTIVTPSYKQLNFLRFCIASVQDQKGVTVEHIVQDAGTPGFASFLESRLTSRQGYSLTPVSEPDTGMYDAINRGFGRSQGEILAWLNCDEQYLPGTLRKVADCFVAHPEVDMIIGDALLIDEQGDFLSYRKTILPNALHTRLAHLNVLSCTIFFRRRLIERGFFLNSSWKAIADAVWISQLLKARVRMKILPELLSAFTFTQSNLGQTSMSYTEMLRWRQSFGLLACLRLPVIVWHRIRKLLANAYGSHSVDAELYTQKSPDQRVRLHSNSLKFTWSSPQNPASAVKKTKHTVRAVLKVLIEGLLVPLVASLLIYMVDQIVPGIVLVPVLSLVALLGFSFFLSPLAVGFAATIFSVAVLMRYLDYANILPHELRNNTYVVVRMAGFIITSILAVLFSISRKRAVNALKASQIVMSHIPVPILVSDATALITFANQEACALLKEEASQLIGKKWPLLMMADRDEGEGTRAYIEFFSSVRSTGTDTLLHLSSDPHQAIAARILCLGEEAKNVMLTVFQARG